MIVADAWDELRMKPTALSPQDLEQLSAEVDRYLVRKSFTDDLAARYKRMLMAPFFARVDFAEGGRKRAGKDRHRPVQPTRQGRRYAGARLARAGLLAVLRFHARPLPLQQPLRRDTRRNDAQAPVPHGKRPPQVLRRYTAQHRRQHTPRPALPGHQPPHAPGGFHHPGGTVRRHPLWERARGLRGGRGGFGQDVHRHAPRGLPHVPPARHARRPPHTDTLPGSAFSEYISAVLPELGEENIRSRTLQEIVEGILGKKVEPPLKQAEKLLDPANEAHMASVRYKGGKAFFGRAAQVRRVVCHVRPQFCQRLAGWQAAHPPRRAAAHV